MKHPFLFSAVVSSLSVLAIGCADTTREDVTAARQEVREQERKLEDIKREEDRKDAEAARTTQKPILGGEDAEERIREQEEQVAEAKRKEAEAKDKLAAGQARDKFVADARFHLDAANRAMEKLKADHKAADDEGKKAIDEQMKDIQSKHDALEKEIDDVEAADLLKWEDQKQDVLKAIDDLKAELGKG